MKNHLKMSFGKWRPLCLEGYELRSDVPIWEGVVGIGYLRLTK